MSSNTATSVSKGCFAYKGKLKRANEEDYVSGTHDKFFKSRLKLYRQLWEDLHLQIDLLRSDLNSKIFDDLTAFSAGCHKDREDKTKRQIQEIPTAVLITGVNTPDHGIMFSNLDCMLKARVSPLVARIRTKDCGRVGTMINAIVQQLTSISSTLDHEEDELDSEKETAEHNLENSAVKVNAVVKRKRIITLSTLAKWYKKIYRSSVSATASPSPSKKIKMVKNPDGKGQADETPMEVDETSKNPLVVIMLEEVENIAPNVLQDFISLCSNYLAALPIVLVFGIATAMTAIHQLLPTSISSLLCMERFQAPPASQYLTQVMDRIIMMPNIPFKLGPKVFHFLLDVFLYHDFSILNFMMGFQCSMLEHFMSNPLSLLCCHQEEIDNTTSHLTHVQLEDIRRQPAFMRYVEGIRGPDQAKLLTDDIWTKRHLAEHLKSLYLLHAKLFPALRFLHCLGSNLPKYPFGKQFRELYSVCLTENVCESEGYHQAFQLLRLMSCDDLREILKLSQEHLVTAKDELEDLEKFHADVEKFLYRLDHLDEEEVEQEGQGQTVNGATTNPPRLLPQRTKLYELKEKLQSMSSQRRKSPYERLREEILNALHKHFKLLLPCPMSQPMHDILYFNNLSVIREHIKAAPRCSIQRALTQPGNYLNCACCQCDADSILPSMPDVCIVYKLHLECGTLVNLYDWLQAFYMIASSKETKASKKSEKKGKPSVEIRARFIRAVSELQFLGFIKATRKKTDHVTRLTW